MNLLSIHFSPGRISESLTLPPVCVSAGTHFFACVWTLTLHDCCGKELLLAIISKQMESYRFGSCTFPEPAYAWSILSKTPSNYTYTVTRPGSPPNEAMSYSKKGSIPLNLRRVRVHQHFWTHCKARCWSSNPFGRLV